MEGIGLSLAVLHQTFHGGKTRGVEWRKSQLRAVIKLITENEDQIFEALDQDLGKHPVEAYRDEVFRFSCSSLFRSWVPRGFILSFMLVPAFSSI